MNMKKDLSISKALFLSCIFLSAAFIAKGQTSYYVDDISGDDRNTGTSKHKAFQSIEKINQLNLLPGDSILFRRGGKWTGTLRPQGNGARGNRIVLGAYGEGAAPILDAEGKKETTDFMSAAILLYNQEYWEFRDIEVRNFEKGDPDRPVLKAGILVLAKDTGTLHDFKLENLKIHKVNGSLDTRENGGVFFNVLADSIPNKRVPTNFDGIYLNKCYFMEVDRCGFQNQSFWRTRDLNSSFGEFFSQSRQNNWYPSKCILIENCRFEDVGGNGLITRVAESPVVQNNLFFRCSSRTTGNASYPYNCNNALWQFNEACYTIYNKGDVDASGFDSDYMCKNTIIQYNYSHDNEYGSLLVCSNGKLTRAFNDGTIVRYNVFQNDGHHVIRISGKTTNTYIYNNVFYIGDERTYMEIIWNKSWGGYSDKTYYFNNIIYNMGYNSNYDFGGSTNNIFSNNIFFGTPALDEPEDSMKITSDPQFLDPGTGGNGFSSLGGYQVHAGSPAIDAGKDLMLKETNDFFGNTVPSGKGVDIGVHEYQQIAGLKDYRKRQINISLDPNPISNTTVLNIVGDYTGEICLSYVDSSGVLIKREKLFKSGTCVSRVLNLEDLMPGIYLLNISSSNFSRTIKLIRNRRSLCLKNEYK